MPEPATSAPAGDEVGGDGRAVELTPDQKLLLVALCSPPGDVRPARPDPVVCRRAERLGWTLTRFNRKLDNVCQKLADAGTRGLHGGVGRVPQPQGSARRARTLDQARDRRRPRAHTHRPGRHVGRHPRSWRRGAADRGRHEHRRDQATDRRSSRHVVVRLVAGLLVWVATRSEGEVVRKADLNDGGIWVTNADQARFGRINKAAGQLDAGVLSDGTPGSGLDVFRTARPSSGCPRPATRQVPIDPPGTLATASRRAAQGGTRHRQPSLRPQPVDLRGGTDRDDRPGQRGSRPSGSQPQTGIAGLDQLQTSGQAARHGGRERNSRGRCRWDRPRPVGRQGRPRDPQALRAASSPSRSSSSSASRRRAPR